MLEKDKVNTTQETKEKIFIVESNTGPVGWFRDSDEKH